MLKFKYFHGDEAEQFSFFRIPRTLIKDDCFHGLSTEAKLLYGLMLDCMGLSLRSGWLDDDNRVFFFYTLQEVQETLSCGHNKATRIFNEMEQYGLIERIKQGQGRPAKIYVKNFAEEESLENADVQKFGIGPSCVRFSGAWGSSVPNKLYQVYTGTLPTTIRIYKFGLNVVHIDGIL